MMLILSEKKKCKSSSICPTSIYVCVKFFQFLQLCERSNFVFLSSQGWRFPDADQEHNAEPNLKPHNHPKKEFKNGKMEKVADI